jgi:hypothetical protein
MTRNSLNSEVMFDKSRNILFSKECFKQLKLCIGDTVSLSYKFKE